jgi:uncharacterized UPF0160 family protein
MSSGRKHADEVLAVGFLKRARVLQEIVRSAAKIDVHGIGSNAAVASEWVNVSDDGSVMSEMSDA